MAVMTDAPGEPGTVPEMRPRRRKPSLLLRVAGVDPAVFHQPGNGIAPTASDRARYGVMGMAVCITALFSTCTIPAALTLATGHFSVIFLLYGCLWGLFVFNLDRWVVSSVDYGPLDGSARWSGVTGQVGRKIALLVIRLTIALLIGLSISEPLVMLIYNAEILTEYHQVLVPRLQAETTDRVLHDPRYPNEYAFQAAALRQADATVASDTRAVSQANAALDAEESGTGGTHRIGVGPRSAERRADLDRAQARLTKAQQVQAGAQQAYDTARSKATRQQQNDLRTELAQINQNPGLLNRETALSSLASHNRPIFDAEWVLRGLILLVDVAPVLLKLLSPISPYERNLRRRVTHEMQIHDYQQADRVAQATAELRLRNDVATRQRDLDGRHRTLLLTQRFRVADERAVRRADLEMRRVIGRHRDDVEAAGLLGLLDIGLVPQVDPRTRLTPGYYSDRYGDPNSGPPTQPPDQPEQTDPPDGRSTDDPVDPSLADGIDQLVDQRWRLGRQITGIGLRRGPRTPFLAYDIYDKGRPRRTYAVKCLGQGDSAKREMEALPYGDAISPYVAPVVHGGYDRIYGWFVVTPFYGNGTLQQLISADDQDLSLGVALTVTEQILLGLRSAFTDEHHFLTHFDIKPSNIAFDDSGNVRIIDWGTACASAGEDDRSMPDMPPGYTLWYAPAEQIDFSRGGNRTWRGPLCDIRAIGAVLYTMITGHPPLYTEAEWLGMLDGDGGLAKQRREDFISLLATEKPLPLREFFHANRWDTRRLAGLSTLVEHWLDPDPARRIVTSSAAPTAHDAALGALHQVVAALRGQHPELLDLPVGAAALPERPRQRLIAVPSTAARRPAYRDEQTFVRMEEGS
jgi:serine/threonine protein kinase